MSSILPVNKLQQMVDQSGEAQTTGLDAATITRFMESDPSLTRAVEEAFTAFQAMPAALREMKESDLIAHLQSDLINFYDPASVNPYVALAARGPWIVTTHGAVLHDSGGYGMLGFGHSPDDIIDAMARPWVMANVMTPSLTQKRFTDVLKAEIGHSRPGGFPFQQFICMNSGSESVTVALRISDVNAANLTAPGARHEGKQVKILAIEGGFHGRTDRPAQASGSSLPKYRKHLASFQHRENLVTVPSNDVQALREAFAAADRDGVFFEMMLAEPVMGEGNPGQALSREFYDAARELTREMGTLLLIDSIQAGLRAHGVLSIVDYPGFQDADAPDMETYSKALNAAQYPLSVLACGPAAAELYITGIYGNTMTTNPRALEVGIATLSRVDDAFRANVHDRGIEFVEKLKALQAEIPDIITKVQGTGLLFSCELADGFKVVGFGGVEEHLRKMGIGVIHGGINSLRFTPHFLISSAEVDLVIAKLRDALLHFRA